MPNSLTKSVEKVIDTIRGRRGASDPAPAKAAEAAPAPAVEANRDEVPQLHLAAAAKANGDDTGESSRRR